MSEILDKFENWPDLIIVLGRNVEQDEMMCSLQESQLCLSYFWSYLPLLYLTVIMH